ncbi:MAG: mechanosensitive ion channel family protein [Thermodesulfobacteriota bacterium]
MSLAARLVLAISLIVFAAGSAPAGEPAAPGAARSEVSKDDLKRLINLLEDDQKRAVFLKDLKALVRLREGSAAATDQSKSEEPAPAAEDAAKVIKPISRGLDTFAEKMVEEARQLAWKVSQMPASLKRAASFLANPNNRFDLLMLLVDFLGGVLAGLSLAVLLRRYHPSIPARKPPWYYLLTRGLVYVLVRVLPYLICLLAVFGLFEVLPVFSPVKDVILLTLWAVLFYKLALRLGRVLISPGLAATRLLPLDDGDADFLWAWYSRLARLTVVYFLVIDGLVNALLDWVLYSLIRDTFLLIFPVLLTVFLIKLAVRWRPIEAEPESGLVARLAVSKLGELKKTATLVRRYWIAPAVIYAWVIFAFIIGRYQAGFTYLFRATLGTVPVVAGYLLALAAADYGFALLFPGLEAREARFSKVFRAAVQAGLFILTAAALAFVWGVPLTALTSSRIGSQMLTRGLAVALTVGVVALVMGGSQAAADWLLREREGHRISQKWKTLTPVVNTAIKAVAVFIGSMVILERLGVDIAPILAGAGIIGLGVGLGAQSLVKDLINGLFILAQDMISVGDWVQVGSKQGLVEAISLRAIRLRDLAGNVHIIPNSSVESVTNMTKVYSRYVFDVGVAYKEDVDRVMEVLETLGREMQADPVYGPEILEPLEVFGLDRFEDSAMIVRARITTNPMKQWWVGREFNRRLKQTFDRLGIEIPFPHRTIYMGQSKTEGQPTD